jgi:hypothetical protein
LVNALRSRDSSWRAEDCRSYRHKPSAGTIECGHMRDRAKPCWMARKRS